MWLVINFCKIDFNITFYDEINSSSASDNWLMLLTVWKWLDINCVFYNMISFNVDFYISDFIGYEMSYTIQWNNK